MTLATPILQKNKSGALRGRDIVCFSNDWNGDPLSKTHLMRLLANDNRILWINSIGYRMPAVKAADARRLFRKLLAAMQPIREVERNIYVFNPIALPIYGKPWAARFNRLILRLQVKRAMRRMGFKKVINWMFLPSAVVVAGELGEETLIYHCVDEFSAFSGNSPRAIAAMERELMERANLVIVSSQLLLESKQEFNGNTSLVRHGVDWNHFRRAIDPATEAPVDIAALPKPVLGFFGLIADWVDFDLLAHVARKFPEGSLVLIGNVTTDVRRLREIPNVHFLGRRQYEQLPAYCKGFDVALMPFLINTLTLNSNPLKVREYLAAGLPVVSTAIPEVEAVGLCHIAADSEEFVAQIRRVLADRQSRSERSDAIRSESWESRLEEIRDIFAGLGENRSTR
jgi:glycosyltransferase involved in cell wall biosynthesis